MSGSSRRASKTPSGSSVGARISISPTMSCARRSDPTGSAQGTPGICRRTDRIGCASAVARPSGIKGTAARNDGSAASIAASTAASRPGTSRTACVEDRRAQVRRRRHAQVLVQRRQLLDRDGPRLEQPPKIGGKIGDRRLEEYPSAGLEHVSEPRDHPGVDAGGRILDERPQVRVRFDVVATRRGPRRPRTAPLPRCRREWSQAMRADRACGEGKRPRAREGLRKSRV